MAKKKYKHKKKIEFSKKMFYVASFVNIAVVAFSCVMIWRTDDITPLCYLIPSVAAEVSTGSAFYYSKAKAENQIKLQKIYGSTPDTENASDTISAVENAQNMTFEDASIV